MHSVVKKTEIYQLESGDINQEFIIGIEINKLEKEVPELPNPSYPEIQKSYNHLKDEFTIFDTDTKNKLPVHVILGAGDYTKIKT